MTPGERVVISFPLRELFDSSGPVAARRLDSLDQEQIRALLRLGPVRFLIVDVGMRPRWVAENECYEFWKHEVAGNLCNSSQIELAEHPRGYCFVASQWEPQSGAPIVVLERHH